MEEFFESLRNKQLLEEIAELEKLNREELLQKCKEYESRGLGMTESYIRYHSCITSILTNIKILQNCESDTFYDKIVENENLTSK